MIGWIITIIVALVIGYLIAKWFISKQKWGEKKAKLELEFNKELQELKDSFVEKEKEHLEKISEIKLNHQENVAQLDEKYKELIKGFRKDAVSRSRSTLLGKLWEHVAPFLPKFKYNPADMKFIGAPIDYIVFDGMGERKLDKVVFLEIKSAKSTLNPQEKRLKEAIDKKKVKWEEFRIDDITKLKFEDSKEFDKELQISLDEIKEDIKEDIEEIREVKPKLKENKSLLEKLKEKRFELAKEKKLPSYCIFNNSVLEELAFKKPTSKKEMIEIKGVGEKKIEEYGDIFLRIIGENLG